MAKLTDAQIRKAEERAAEAKKEAEDKEVEAKRRAGVQKVKFSTQDINLNEQLQRSGCVVMEQFGNPMTYVFRETQKEVAKILAGTPEEKTDPAVPNKKAERKFY